MHTQETKDKIRRTKIGYYKTHINPLLGTHRSKITKKKLSDFRKEYYKTHNHPLLGKHPSEETIRKISESNKGRVSSFRGKHHTKETKKKNAEAHKGKHCSDETKNKLRIKLSGENNPNWKGGIESIHHKVRTSNEYKRWRELIFQRDNYTCQLCNSRNGNIEAHHILSFMKYKQFRLDLRNGATLCKTCHKLLHKSYNFN